MAFQAKTDYFSIADSSSIVVTDAADGKTASEITAMNEAGAIVANEVFGETCAPSNTYKLKADVASKTFSLGAVTTFDTNHKAMLGSVTITTGAAQEPTIQASGEQVEDAATTGCKFDVTVTGLKKCHHAQTLLSAFTLAGDASVQSATYTISGTIGKTTKDGDCIASDITQARVTCALSITQYGATAPTLTAGTDWTITAPLARTDADASYPSWSATLTKNLAITEAE